MPQKIKSGNSDRKQALYFIHVLPLVVGKGSSLSPKPMHFVLVSVPAISSRQSLVVSISIDPGVTHCSQ